MKKLDVMFTIDKKYIDMMLGTMYSLILNGNFENIRFHIITSNLSLEDYKKIEKTTKIFDGTDICFYDIKKFDIERFNIPDWKGTQIANARLFFQEILDENLTKIENLLYLDSDTIVLKELNEIDEHKNYGISAVREANFRNYIEKLGLEKYYNSGVLFINVKEWLENGYQDKIIHFIETSQKKFQYPDQDIINCALKNEINDLPLNYNVSATSYLFQGIGEILYYNEKKRTLSYQEVRESKKDPKIIHSTGILGIKPWTNNNINPFNEEYMKYILLANKDFIKEDISFFKELITKSPLLFKACIISKNYMPNKAQETIKKLIKM